MPINPGTVTEQNRINLDSIQDINPIRHAYFKFDNTVKSKQFITIPVGFVISNKILVRLEESFDGSDTLLNIGVAGNVDAVGCVGVNSASYFDFVIAPDSIVGLVRVERTPLFWSILEQGTPSTKGRGWCLMEFINASKVRA